MVFESKKVSAAGGFAYGAHLIYAINEPKSVLARDLGDCRDNLRNSQSVFLIVLFMAVLGPGEFY